MAPPTPASHWAQVPPWLWLWIVLFLTAVPRYWQRLAQLYETDEGAFRTTPGTVWDLLWAYHALPVNALPVLLLLAGVLLAAVPAVSRWMVLRGRRLRPLSRAPGPALGEILAFLGQHAPGLEVTANLAEVRHTAMVYPLGYRRSAIGIFGRLVTTWQRDPVAGRGILLHEIAHHRQGDALLVNAGSPLLLALRLYPWMLLLALLIFTYGAFRDTAGQIIDTAALDGGGRFVLQVVLLQFVPWLLVFVVAQGLWPVALFLPLVVAIWCVELNADRFALATSAVEREAYVRFLDASRRRGLARILSHPPLALRLWCARRAEHLSSLAAILLLFPLAWFCTILLDLLYHSILRYGMGVGTEVIVAQLGPMLLRMLGANALYFAAMATFALGWMLLVSRSGAFPAGAPPVRRTAFVATAAVALAFTAAGFAGRMARRPVTIAGPEIVTDRPAYRPGEPVLIRYAGLPGTATDWITVVAEAAPQNEWGDWVFVQGRNEGVLSRTAAAPGTYEVRLFFDWPTGGFVIRASSRFVVTDPVQPATPAATDGGTK